MFLQMEGGIDLVILTANPWPAFRTSVEIVRQNGRVSIVSLLGRGEPPLDFKPSGDGMVLRQGDIADCRAWRGCSIISACRCIGPFGSLRSRSFSYGRKKKLQPSRLITHRLHYTEMVQAYEMAYAREKSMLGVIFNWRE